MRLHDLQTAGLVRLVEPGVIHPGATFTRASVGTHLAGSMLLETAAVNVPRWEYSAAGVLRGLLMEAQRTNALSGSEAISSADYLITASLTISDDAAAAPTGETTAEVVAASGGSATLYHLPAAAPGASVVYSVFTKAGTLALGRFLLRNDTTATNFDSGIFDFAAGTISGTGWTVTPFPNGWYRLRYARASGITAGNSLRCYCGITGASLAAGDSWKVWGLQLEGADATSSYIKTPSGATATRSADVLTYPTPSGAAGTLILTHDAASGANLVTSGANTVLLSAGSGKTAVAWDASGSMVVSNGAAGVSGAALTFDTTLRLLKDANAHVLRADLYSYAMNEADMRARTAA